MDRHSSRISTCSSTIPASNCLECWRPVCKKSHFSRFGRQCGLCAFRTCCIVSFSLHIKLHHAQTFWLHDVSVVEAINGELLTDQAFSCSCGYRTRLGNLLASHIAKCTSSNACARLISSEVMSCDTESAAVPPQVQSALNLIEHTAAIEELIDTKDAVLISSANSYQHAKETDSASMESVSQTQEACSSSENRPACSKYFRQINSREKRSLLLERQSRELCKNHKAGLFPTFQSGALKRAIAKAGGMTHLTISASELVQATSDADLFRTISPLSIESNRSAESTANRVKSCTDALLDVEPFIKSNSDSNAFDSFNCFACM